MKCTLDNTRKHGPEYKHTLGDDFLKDGLEVRVFWNSDHLIMSYHKSLYLSNFCKT